MSVAEFKEKIRNGELLEWQEVYKDNYYGTLKSEVERIWNNGRHVLFDLDVQGGINLKNLFPGITLSVFIMPPSLDELGSRLRLRSTDTEENIRKRMEKAASEITFSGKFDKIIVNDELEKAVSEAIQTIRKFLKS